MGYWQASPPPLPPEENAMARTRSTTAETESLDAPEATAPTNPEGAETPLPEISALSTGNAEASVTIPALPQQLAVTAPSSAPVQAPDRPGLVTIRNGEAMRQVHPVDVAEWLELGWMPQSCA